MSENQDDHFTWITDVVQTFINNGSKPTSPEWDTRESYLAATLANLADDFDQFSRVEKRDIFLFMLGVVISTADWAEGPNE